MLHMRLSHRQHVRDIVEEVQDHAVQGEGQLADEGVLQVLAARMSRMSRYAHDKGPTRLAPTLHRSAPDYLTKESRKKRKVMHAEVTIVMNRLTHSRAGLSVSCWWWYEAMQAGTVKQKK